MNQFKIKKSELKNNFTGIYTPDLGTASGCLKLCGLKLFLYLAGNANNMVWTVNPAAYANWLGLDYNKQGRTVRKAIKELGGNMPETLPTPEKSIKELEKDELQKIGNNQ